MIGYAGQKIPSVATWAFPMSLGRGLIARQTEGCRFLNDRNFQGFCNKSVAAHTYTVKLQVIKKEILLRICFICYISAVGFLIGGGISKTVRCLSDSKSRVLRPWLMLSKQPLNNCCT